MEFFNSSALMEAFVDILVCAVPIWLAVMIGLLIGWSWRPRWSGLLFLGLRSKLRYVWTLPPGLGARRFWLAFTALSAFSLCRGLWFRSRGITRRKLEKESASNLPAASAQESVENGSCRDIRYLLSTSYANICTLIIFVGVWIYRRSIQFEPDLDKKLHLMYSYTVQECSINCD